MASIRWPEWSVCAVGLGAIAFAAIAAPRADGETLRWVNATGGLFTDAANWDLLRSPESGDTALFDLQAAYTVTVGSELVDTLRVSRGTVTFDGSLSADNAWSIFGRAILTGSGRGGALDIIGEMRISGANGSYRANSSDHLVRSAGDLVIEDGGRLYTDGLGFFRVDGSALVTGAGSSFGPRSTTIGGQLDLRDGAVGFSEQWDVTGDVNVVNSRVNNEIVFNATNGARVSVTDGVLDGSGSEYSFIDSTLTISGDSTVRGFAGFERSTLSLNLTEAWFAADDPVIEGTIGARHYSSTPFVDSTLLLNIHFPFVPEKGDTMHLMRLDSFLDDEWDTSTGFTEVEVLGFTPGVVAELDWVVDHENHRYDAYVRFVPSPGGGVAFAIAGSWMLRRRRHARMITG